MESTEHRPTSRVLDILELLATSSEGLTLTEIANTISAPKSSIFPIIRTMTQRKFIFFNKNSYKYNIGINCFCIGSSYTNNMNALEFIKSEMKFIVKQTNEICQMGIMHQGKVLYVAKVDSDDPIRIISYVGKKLPAYCTALGKAMLCQNSFEELRLLYPTTTLPAFTKNTITDLNILFSQLLEIRKTHIAMEFGEINEQSCCVGIPIYQNGMIIAAISVSVPFFRMSNEKTNLIKSLLLDSKAKIETFLRDNHIDSNSFLISD